MHLGLVGIELVVFLVERLGEGIDLAIWVELVPGVATLVAVTGFQDHHEGIETEDDLVEVAVGDLVVLVLVWVGG